MKTAVVTGATGFIGGALTKKLLSNGVKVYGIGIDEEKLKELKGQGEFIPIKADFSQYEYISQLIKDDVDVFYHFAWMGYGKATNEFDTQIINVCASVKAIEVAIKIGCKKFILACSSHEYQKNYIDNDMEKEAGFCSIYGASKIAAKHYCRVMAHNYGIQFNGVIFTNVFGVGDESNRSANMFIKQLLKKRPLKLIKGDNLYDWTYIDDVVGGVIAVGEKGKRGREYYVGSRELRPFKQIITEVRDILAPGIELKFGEYKDTAYIDYDLININQLYNDTGYLPSCDFKQSVLKTAEWIKTFNI